ncbi:MAG: CoA pyrophosphatase [Flavobacteriaceae bacterium]|nr:CoA pyrophosphatase [Flavobacteriaceae bacterium]
MDFNSFLTHISRLKNVPLGGLDSQFKMAPKLRLKFTEDHISKRNPKESAVMALFYPDKKDQTRFLLMLRPNYNGTHASQISFPGGKKDIHDQNLIATALRETEEEVGISKKNITIYRELTKTYIPPSNFWVTPFLGVMRKHPMFITNDEVELLVEVKLADLLDDQYLITKNLTTSYMKNIDVPCFYLNDHIVWGATAMILSEVKDLFNSLD